MQCTSTLLMVRPVSFGFNEQTAGNNHFQDREISHHPVHLQALKEFEMMVEMLKNHEIEVLVVNDTPEPAKPDAVFPNNWFSCNNNAIYLFPMYALNRRTEKRKDIIEEVKKKTGITAIHDMSHHEKNSAFLEGTGSMVCDHQHKIIYACLSERTDEQLLKEYAVFTGYSTCSFSAADKNGREIYHTNVMMCIGEHFAVVCADAITNKEERHAMINKLELTGHEIILISHDQINSFAGNMLQVNSKAGVPFLLMSKTAASSLNPSQLTELKKYISPLVADVTTIEKAGGGSVRCMVAELF